MLCVRPVLTLVVLVVRVEALLVVRSMLPRRERSISERVASGGYAHADALRPGSAVMLRARSYALPWWSSDVARSALRGGVGHRRAAGNSVAAGLGAAATGASVEVAQPMARQLQWGRGRQRSVTQAANGRSRCVTPQPSTAITRFTKQHGVGARRRRSAACRLPRSGQHHRTTRQDAKRNRAAARWHTWCEAQTPTRRADRSFPRGDVAPPLHRKKHTGKAVQ